MYTRACTVTHDHRCGCVQVLCQIYRFRDDSACPEGQEVEPLLNLFLEFVRSTTQQFDDGWTPEMVAALSRVASNLDPTLSTALRWYPKFGCALLLQRLPQEVVRISLLALDQWEVSLHSSRQRCEHKADARSYRMFECGEVDEDRLDELLPLVEVCERALILCTR